MTLPDHLLRAIARDARDADHARGLVAVWERVLPELEARTDRIRAELAARRCRCELPAPVHDGRCTRCYGLRPEDADRRALLRALPPGADP